MPWRLFVCLLIFGSCLNTASSQHHARFFKSIDQSDGLSELQITYMAQDSRGFMWFGSYDGLNRFDGKNVRVYRPTLPDSSYSPNITSKVMEDNRGRLWFSTSGGLHAISPAGNALNAVVLPPPAPGHALNPEHILLHLDQQNRAWVIAHNWLHLYDPTTGRDSLLHPLSSFTCYPLVAPDGAVRGIINLLAGEGGGLELIQYRPEGIRSSRWFTGENGSPQALALFAWTAGDSIVWLPTDIGLIRLQVDAPEKSRIFRPESYPSTRFFDVAPWGADQLIVTSTSGGYFVFDHISGREKFTAGGLSIRLPGQVQIRELQNVFVGRDQSLWFSIWNKGVFYSSLRPAKFQTFEHPSRLDATRSLPVSSIAEDEAGNIWTASDEGGVVVRTVEGELRFPAELNIPPYPNKLLCDQSGELWAFNANTVWLKRRNDTTFRMVARGLNRLFSIRQMSADRFLLVCPEGIFELDKNELEVNFANQSPLLRNGSMLDVFPDADGRLYLSDEVDKLSIYAGRPEGLQLEKEFSGTGYIGGMTADPENVWFASSKGLLQFHRADQSISFVKGDRRSLEHSFNSVLPDAAGNLWLSSNLGIFSYKAGSIRHYTESDGLQGLQFKMGSACRLSRGRLAFGGVNGYHIFHPDSLRDNPDPPRVHFTGWVVNDTEAHAQNPEFLPNQVFSFQNRTHTFYFVGIDYTAPDEVQYRYLLKGFEMDTVNGGLNGFARYAQLPAGAYTLQVWAANSDGVWSPKPKELAFTILPPWYATRWARTVQALLLAGLLFAFYKNRINVIQRKEAVRRKEAEYLRKEAESKQLAAELENAVLRLQMNPHFLFNSMNSISSYMLQKDVDTAHLYLNRFAALMRNILELAPRATITIADELALLEQYLQAEAMRLPGQFSWAFVINDNIDPDEEVLPTMILQPFVENAIWHGLAQKATPGRILIAIDQENDTLRCIVEDNGVGRKNEAVAQHLNHRSKALEITRQRLKQLHHGQYLPDALEIIDLYDETGAPAGTRVVLRVRE